MAAFWQRTSGFQIQDISSLFVCGFLATKFQVGNAVRYFNKSCLLQYSFKIPKEAIVVGASPNKNIMPPAVCFLNC